MFCGEAVYVRWQKGIGVIRLERDKKGKYVLHLPQGVTREQGEAFLAGMAFVKKTHPKTRTEAERTLACYCEKWLSAFGAEDVLVRYAVLPGRWGRCLYRERVIELSTECCLLSESHIEALLLHELCHLKIPDHTPPFWEQLTAHLPDWARREGELRSMYQQWKGYRENVVSWD